MSIFTRLGQGIKTTFHIKDLTPEQKAQAEKKKQEARAYREIVSAKEKEAWQMAYQQEIARQRKLQEQQKVGQAMSRAMIQAQREVQGQPKQRMSWLSAPARALGSVFPAPKVSTPMSRGTWDIGQGGSGMMGYTKQPKQRRVMTTPQQDWITRELGGITTPSYSAQAIGKKLHKHKHHPLKHLGTAKGGVTISLNGTQVTLGQPTQRTGTSHRKRHLKHSLKNKLKTPKQSGFNDMLMRL